MAEHGGYRPPANPAPVSGPGELSQRTDGRQPMMDLPNAKYGENADFQAIQSGAPLPQVSTPTGGGAPPAPPGPTPLPLTAGTLNPTQPVTHGADAGPGPGADALALGNPIQTQHASALSMIKLAASQPSASPAIQYLAKTLAQGF